MNLLHFTCKFGAKQIGRENEASQVMNALIEKYSLNGINRSGNVPINRSMKKMAKLSAKK